MSAPRRIIYIAGPMRGIPHYNWPAFAAAAAHIRALGHEAVSPAEMDEAGGFVTVRRAGGVVVEVTLTDKFNVDDALTRDLDALDDCDDLVLLPGWKQSEGAKAELAYAEIYAKRTYLSLEDIPSAVEGPAPETTVPDIAGRDLGARGETRVVDPNTGGAKCSKLARFDLLPADVLWLVAEHLGKGASKYDARNWELGYPWGLSYAALQRHAHRWWSGEEIDEDTGSHHLDAVIVHAMFLRAFTLRGAGTDDRGGR